MTWILKNTETGMYVAEPGSAGSYTNRLERAQRFPTREAAEANKCGNEHALRLEDAR